MQGGDDKSIRECTARQALALMYWKKDKFRSKARALRKAGYSEAVARQPHKVFDSPALRNELFFLGIGSTLSQHQKEQGKTLHEWKKEISKEEENKEKIDKAIKQITPDQLSTLREKLVAIGYNSNTKMQETVTNFPSQSTSGEMFENIPVEKSHTDSVPSFSSM